MTRQSRMSLDSVSSGIVDEPLGEVIYGPEKVGKSTWAASAPDPIFLDTEEGSKRLKVRRFPKPRTWQDVLDAIGELLLREHSYRSLVIDTIDWLEPLIWREVCVRGDGRGSVDSIEDFGFGKGYTKALELWRELLAILTDLRDRRAMNVILVAHAEVKRYTPPSSSDGWDRYQMKINGKAAAVVKEWGRSVLFANFEERVEKDRRTKRTRGVASGARFIYTQRTAAYDAGSRYGLPPRLPLSFSEFFAAARHGVEESQPDPRLLEDLDASIGMLQELGTKESAKAAATAIAFRSKAGRDELKLRKVLGWCEAKLVEFQEAKEEKAECPHTTWEGIAGGRVRCSSCGLVDEDDDPEPERKPPLSDEEMRAIEDEEKRERAVRRGEFDGPEGDGRSSEQVARDEAADQVEDELASELDQVEEPEPEGGNGRRRRGGIAPARRTK